MDRFNGAKTIPSSTKFQKKGRRIFTADDEDIKEEMIWISLVFWEQNCGGGCLLYYTYDSAPLPSAVHICQKGV